MPSITDGFKWNVVEELMKRDSRACLQFLKELLTNWAEDDKIIAAEYLVKARDLDGVQYYVDWMEKYKNFRDRRSKLSPLQTLRDIDDIPFLLETVPFLISLLRLSYEKDLVQGDYDNLNGTVQETLSAIAVRLMTAIRK